MRHRNLLLLIGSILLALSTLRAAAVEEGSVAPQWRATTFDGRTVAFPALAEGKPAVVVFWATWCGYCRAFMPYLQNIAADYAEQGVKIVTINAKEERGADPQGYVRALGFKPIAIANGDAIAAAYDVEYIPGLMIVDGDGMVAYRRPWTDLPAGQTVAELWDGQVREALDRLLK